MAKDIIGLDQLQKEVSTSTGVVLVDFWAERCGPCRMLGPVLQEVSEENEGKVTVLKVDVDEPGNEELAMKYNVRSIPQVTIFKNGEQVDQFIGALPKTQVMAYVEKHT